MNYQKIIKTSLILTLIITIFFIIFFLLAITKKNEVQASNSGNATDVQLLARAINRRSKR